MELAFYGGSFTAIEAAQQEELLSAAMPYVADGTVDSIRLSTRPDAIDDAVVARLRRYGVQTVELGAQSMVDEVLYQSGRGHTAQDTVQAVGQLKKAGFSCVLQMMTGLPGSNEERDVETARRIIALAPDGVRIYPTVIVKDTPLEELWRAGRYQEHTVEEAVQTCVRILPMMEQAGIPIIRLGLNPTQELSGGAAVGGAYHPAFGELVRAELLRRQAAALLEGVSQGSRVVLGVAPERVSPMIGQHRQNILRLTAQFGLRSLTVRPTESGQTDIRILECTEK
jgi:histone acetyltransferase (RNA polymerase elongator complex component)